MATIDAALPNFEDAWDRVDHSLWGYRDDGGDDPGKTDADKKRELSESMRSLADAALAVATELDVP